MMDLSNIQTIKSLLEEYGLSPQKRFGQNFLIDQSVIDKLLQTANLNKNDVVVEVGPGLGTLTTQIAPQVKKLIAVEFDRNMVAILNSNETIKQFSNLTIENEDILDFNPNNLISNEPCLALRFGGQAKTYKIIGAIPYQITSPLIHKIISWQPQPTATVFLIQKEVAEKICSQPPHASYLSNFVSAFAHAEIIKIIKPSSFYPAPKVHSAILKIQFHPSKIPLNPEIFSRFLHRGFQNPRKMLNKVFAKELLQKLKIDPQLRPENLTLTEWFKIYQDQLQNRQK